jgi:hypothetical protein
VDSGVLQLTDVVASFIVRAGASLAELSVVRQREIDMTILQDAAVRSASPQGTDAAPAPLSRPASSEPRAQIAILSPAKRNALLTCLDSSGLHKKDGAWHGAPGSKPVSGVTVADLARDGMLTLTTDHGHAVARLTERGNWFARTLLREAAGEKVKDGL